MSIQTVRHLILGVNEQGRKFRPSDWPERIASMFGSFDADKRIRYNPMVMPARYDDPPGLYVSTNLAERDPSGYQFIMEFARRNNLTIKNIVQSILPDSSIDMRHVA